MSHSKTAAGTSSVRDTLTCPLTRPGYTEYSEEWRKCKWHTNKSHQRCHEEEDHTCACIYECDCLTNPTYTFLKGHPTTQACHFTFMLMTPKSTCPWKKRQNMLETHTYSFESVRLCVQLMSYQDRGVASGGAPPTGRGQV